MHAYHLHLLRNVVIDLWEVTRGQRSRTLTAGKCCQLTRNSSLETSNLENYYSDAREVLAPFNVALRKVLK